MGDRSKNFSNKEFDCRCGKCDSWDVIQDLIKVVQDVRDHFGTPIKINSGYRCHEYNRLIGGVKNSRHCLGLAADLDVKDISPVDVQDYLDEKYPDKYGIGRYNSFTHIDVRDKKARW